MAPCSSNPGNLSFAVINSGLNTSSALEPTTDKTQTDFRELCNYCGHLGKIPGVLLVIIKIDQKFPFCHYLKRNWILTTSCKATVLLRTKCRLPAGNVHWKTLL